MRYAVDAGRGRTGARGWIRLGEVCIKREKPWVTGNESVSRGMNRGE